MEIALIKYNKKTWCKSALLGFFIGLAVIVPGISGSTVAIIFKLYDQFLYAIGNLFKKFKACFLFLLPIGIGLVAGFLLGLIGVQKLLEINMFAVVCLFAGLMTGAFPAVKDEIKGAQITAKRVALFILGLMIPVAMGCVSAWQTADAVKIQAAESIETAKDIFTEVQTIHVILAVVFGFIVGITQVVPGLSASAFLMTVGWYNSLMSSVSMTYWKSNFAIFFVYAGLGIGFLLGLFSFSKLLTYLFDVARHTSYCMIVGLSLGSIVSMFCNGDIINVYLAWSQSGVAALDIVLGAVLFAIGCVGAYMLVKYQRKKDKEGAKDSVNE
jgi:putative membrane protein